MTITLCLETSGPHCSLALAQAEQIYTVERLLQRRHNEELLALLDELFEQAECQPVDVELVCFGCGPGSFTGVRIAAAVTQALALVANATVVPVRSSWTLAATAAQALPTSREHFVTCVPSRGQAYYLGAFTRDTQALGNLLVEQSDVLTDVVPEWLEAGLANSSTAIVGACPAWLPASLQPCYEPDLIPSAKVMVAYGRAVHEAGNSLPVEQALPLYIEGDSPWRKQVN